MHPAFSVIFLTTLIGAGQGLFLAIFTGQSYAAVQLVSSQDSVAFYGVGGLIALLLLAGGLASSFFHLGRPERAWRAATQWRTSWLSREVIALPIFMGVAFVYGVMHLGGFDAIFVHRIEQALHAAFENGILGAVVSPPVISINMRCTVQVHMNHGFGRDLISFIYCGFHDCTPFLSSLHLKCLP